MAFCAEQGFAGAFSEHVLNALAAGLTRGTTFLIGTRGTALAMERGITAHWTGAILSYSA